MRLIFGVLSLKNCVLADTGQPMLHGLSKDSASLKGSMMSNDKPPFTTELNITCEAVDAQAISEAIKKLESTP
jgi:hypothetical protein